MIPRGVMRPSWTALLAGAWLVSVAGALGALGWYSGQAAWPAGVPVWPAGSSIRRSENAPTLLVFLHPRCPCSRASLANLERLVAHLPGAIDLRMVIFRPGGADADWDDSGIRARASRVSGARIEIDVEGAEARRFAAPVSGTMVLYRPDGRLAFAGGITPARGHEGDCAGMDQLLDILSAGATVRREPAGKIVRAPAFGCAVTDAPCPAGQGADSRENR